MLRLYLARTTRKAQSQDGRRLLAQAWSEASPEKMPEIRIAENGKPYFADSPWHFSIAHSDALVICGFSDSPVGADAEKIRPYYRRLEQKVLTLQERASVETPEDFFRLWTQKEAYVKYTGEGLAGLPRMPQKLEGTFFTQRVGEYVISVYSQSSDPLELRML